MATVTSALHHARVRGLDNHVISVSASDHSSDYPARRPPHERYHTVCDQLHHPWAACVDPSVANLTCRSLQLFHTCLPVPRLQSQRNRDQPSVSRHPAAVAQLRQVFVATASATNRFLFSGCRPSPATTWPLAAMSQLSVVRHLTIVKAPRPIGLSLTPPYQSAIITSFNAVAGQSTQPLLARHIPCDHRNWAACFGCSSRLPCGNFICLCESMLHFCVGTHNKPTYRHPSPPPALLTTKKRIALRLDVLPEPVSKHTSSHLTHPHAPTHIKSTSPTPTPTPSAWNVLTGPQTSEETANRDMWP